MEQADYDAARELFGDAGLKPLDSYLPKTLKEFEVGMGSAASATTMLARVLVLVLHTDINPPVLYRTLPRSWSHGTSLPTGSQSTSKRL